MGNLQIAYVKDTNTNNCVPLTIGGGSSIDDAAVESGLYLWETETLPGITEYIFNTGDLFPSPNKKYYQLVIGAIEIAFEDFEIDHVVNKLTLHVPPKNKYPVKLRFWSTKNALTTSAVVKHVFTTIAGTTTYTLSSGTFPSANSSDYLVTLDRKELNEDEFTITENNISVLVPITAVTKLIIRYFQTQTQYIHEGIVEAPKDSNYYLRNNGAWLKQHPFGLLPGELKQFINTNVNDIIDNEQRYDILYTDGRAISRSTYAALFSVIGTKYGMGDGVTTFNLPVIRDELNTVEYASFEKMTITTDAAPSSGAGLSLVYLSDEDKLFVTNLENNSQCYKVDYNYENPDIPSLASFGQIKTPMSTYGRRHFYNPIEKAIYSSGYSQSTMQRLNLSTLSYENAGFGTLFNNFGYVQTCDNDGNFYIPEDGVGIYKVPPSKDSKTLVIDYSLNKSDSLGYHFALAKFPKSNKLFASVGIGSAGGVQGYYILDLITNTLLKVNMTPLSHGTSNSNNVRAVPFVNTDSVLVLYSNGTANIISSNGTITPVIYPDLLSSLTTFGVGVATIAKNDDIQFINYSQNNTIKLRRYSKLNVCTYIAF